MVPPSALSSAVQQRIARLFFFPKAPGGSLLPAPERNPAALPLFFFSFSLVTQIYIF